MTFSIFLATIIPLLFLVGLLRKENRVLMLCFCWGLVAFYLAKLGNGAIAERCGVGREEMIVSVAPIVEELLKFFPLLIFLFWHDTEGRFAILRYGMAVGIGFSIQENYLYLENYRLLGEDSLLMLILMRGMSTSLMHGLTTAMVGFGLCAVKKFRFFTFQLIFGLLAFAILSHSLFNLYINSPLKLLGILLPVFIYIVGFLSLHSLEEEGSVAA